jgi:hypothetical protein
VSSEWTRLSLDPDGREVVFDAGSHLHLAKGARGWLLDHIDVILGAIEVPDFRQDDPVPGRERFYRADFPAPDRWLRVVVDFNDTPGWVVTALDQGNDPRPKP